MTITEILIVAILTVLTISHAWLIKKKLRDEKIKRDLRRKIQLLEEERYIYRVLGKDVVHLFKR